MWFLVLIAFWRISAGEHQALIEVLPNEAFTASESYPNAVCYPDKARRTSASGWCAASSDPDGAYLQIDLGQEYEIESVSTWKRADAAQYVTKYTLSYSLDDSTYSVYGDGEELNGNENNMDEVNNKLDPSINARYLRFTPTAQIGWASMRVEAYGIDVAKVSCDAFQIDEFLASCSDLFESNVDGLRTLQGEINDVNTRLDDVITNIGDVWNAQDLSSDLSSSSGGVPAKAVIGDNIDNNNNNNNDVKKWFDDYRDNLIVLSLALNVLVIGYIVFMAINGRKKYEPYHKVKYVDSSDNENAAIKM